jgi:hypothetical protein
MKLHRGKPFSPKASAAVAAPVIVLLALTVVSLYDVIYGVHVADEDDVTRRAAAASFSTSPSTSRPAATSSKPSSPPPAVGACDVTRGEWVPDTEPPYYTNLTCPFIDNLQNCMKFGKPSLEFLRWRWRPDGCELYRFDPTRFLEAMRGKSIAFVGDSLARNHVKSLLCILSKVRTSTHM